MTGATTHELNTVRDRALERTRATGTEEEARVAWRKVEAHILAGYSLTVPADKRVSLDKQLRTARIAMLSALANGQSVIESAAAALATLEDRL